MPAGVALGQVEATRVAAVLATSGLQLDLGAVVLRVFSTAPTLATALQSVYRHHPVAIDTRWTDLEIGVDRHRLWRRWWRPMVTLRADATHPFEPFPAAAALPLLEWGANWLLAQRLHHLLLLHAGAVEKDGYALLLPALPGSGKSTLTAALSLRGWRLLSDEFGAYDPEGDGFRALLKPVALKNASIDVIRRFADKPPLGPVFEKTRKGTVAHLAASPDAVARRRELARPGAFVLPSWHAGSTTKLEPVPPEALFSTLAFNSFNYRVLGAVGFEAALRLARTRPAWRLVYSDLDEAIAAIEELWQQAIPDNARTQPRILPSGVEYAPR